jgi:hypothetical protein
MGFNIQILSEKLEFQKNGETIIDLTTRSIADFENTDFFNRYIVNSNHIMRPDLFVYELNKETDFTEILKTNYISNPFTIDTNDVIFIKTTNTNFVIKPNVVQEDSDTDIRKNYVNPDKAAIPDANIKKLSNKFSFLEGLGKDTSLPSPSNLPPNFNEFGEGEVEVINNKVRFAPGTGRNASDCSTEPISKAELISQVLKNKLNS